jgi:hypothetical protein
MTSVSEALLFTRSSPKIARAEDWDRWEVDKHMYDLVRGPGVTSSTMYRRLVDPRLPQALTAGPRRAVTYRAPDLAEMRLWLDSEKLREAVADGRTWIDAYDPLEDQWFTGNVYNQIRHAGAIPDVDSDILAERFEVPAALATEFENWLDDHVARIAGLAGVAAVQSFRVVRDIRNELYLSPGNYALVAAIEAGDDAVGRLTTTEALATIRASQDWELRLAYQTRELLTPGGHMFAPESDSRQ